MRLARSSDKSLPALAADLGISSEALRHWLRQPGALTTDEREALRRLRREHHILKQERAIVNKATACFAQEIPSAATGSSSGSRPSIRSSCCAGCCGASARAQVDADLLAQIGDAYVRSRRTYGAPRLHATLRAAGVRCARKRVARLLRAAGLVGGHRRRRVRTTVAEPTHAPAPNIAAREFTAPAPDRLWIGDSTYVATREGWLYWAVLTDVYSRRVVGWTLADHRRAAPTLDALAMALRARRPPPGLVHHTDRGGQYTAAAYHARLAARGVTGSMSRAGECLDNAMAERFFAIGCCCRIRPRSATLAVLSALPLFPCSGIWNMAEGR